MYERRQEVIDIPNGVAHRDSKVKTDQGEICLPLFY